MTMAGKEIAVGGTNSSRKLDQAVQQLACDGYCIIPDVLSDTEVCKSLATLHQAVEEMRAQNQATFMPDLDPNSSSIRVFHLLALNPLFRDLIRHPDAIAMVEGLLGPDFLISNFTANIALPGSRSMALHSDQAIVVPGPWLHPWAINIIWCLTDCYGENGATLFIPGSHGWTTREDVPRNAVDLLVPFEAPAGSIIAMDGRMWHTSGANITKDEERALLFGYYTKPFLRPQVNWNALLPSELQENADHWLRKRLGLGISANVGKAEVLSNDLGVVAAGNPS